MASILVTGANGCIGASVVKHLLDRGDRVTALDRSSETHRLEAIIEPERLAEVECPSKQTPPSESMYPVG